MTDRIRGLIDHHFAEHDNAGMTLGPFRGWSKKWPTKPDLQARHPARPSPHVFSQLHQEGDLHRALMALLGYDRLATTEIYLNLSPEDAIREFQNKW